MNEINNALKIGGYFCRIFMPVSFGVTREGIKIEF